MFVGGIHGAGKGTLCSAVAKRVAARHLSAGQLIGGARHQAVASKRVEDVDANQGSLLSALQEYSSEPRVLLDGHFALLGSDGIERVPADVFRGINPVALIVVVVDPEEAVRRLEARDGASCDLATLSSLQRAELSHARKVAEQFAVRLVQLRSHDVETAVSFFGAALEIT